MRAVGWRLNTRNHLRRIAPNLPELSEEELIFLCVTDFRRNIYSNGWDGYIFNTDNEFGDFLPVALAAIGAHQLAELAFEALQWEEYVNSVAPEEIERRGIKPPGDSPFFHCPEKIDDLLYQFWNSRRAAFPSSDPVSKEEVNEYELECECLNHPDLRSWPRFTCPTCSTIYISREDDGECPRCAIDRRLQLKYPHRRPPG